jgi:hypothetical protein
MKKKLAIALIYIFYYFIALPCCYNAERNNPYDPKSNNYISPDKAAVISDQSMLEIIFSSGDTASSVTGNLTLINTGSKGTAITWVSSNPSAIDNNGIVTQPISGSVSVILTATITKGAASDIKNFYLTVNTDADKAAVISDKAALLINFYAGDNESSVKGNLNLENAGPNGTTITWSSNNYSVIANNGIVTRPIFGNVSVTLTAIISRGSASDNKYFYLTVIENTINPENCTAHNEIETVEGANDSRLDAENFNITMGTNCTATIVGNISIGNYDYYKVNTGSTNALILDLRWISTGNYYVSIWVYDQYGYNQYGGSMSHGVLTTPNISITPGKIYYIAVENVEEPANINYTLKVITP